MWVIPSCPELHRCCYSFSATLVMLWRWNLWNLEKCMILLDYCQSLPAPNRHTIQWSKLAMFIPCLTASEWTFNLLKLTRFSRLSTSVKAKIRVCEAKINLNHIFTVSAFDIYLHEMIFLCWFSLREEEEGHFESVELSAAGTLCPHTSDVGLNDDDESKEEDGWCWLFVYKLH